MNPLTIRRAAFRLRTDSLLWPALSAALVLAPGVALAQGDARPAAPSAAPAGAGRDCSRWPQSVYDETTGSCVCPSGMWWNLRGDACLPKEHAAGEFCTTVWPGSEPFFVGTGGYRCVCAPPLLWDEQATACRQPIYTGGEEECQNEWPGTLPVLSPSGTESECRCPGGRRWDEATRSCVPGAPVIAQRAFVQEYGAPAGGIPIPPPPGGYPGGGPGGSPGATPGGGGYNGSAPGAGSDMVDPNAPVPGAGAAPPPADGRDLQAIPPPPRSAGGNANCDALLAEIRSRASAGDSASADALGMKAAVSGCDPKAISDAARTK